ncbi:MULTISPECIES: exosporium protein ExsG [Bacillus]|uniref:exosporium protein ExsG n=1 Tax=Bacillus TaxID=1386 RepID=UPI00046969B9|nr:MULTISPECIES: exosporium protein ExsG [Bacillus]MED1410135.1 exosporium protein ExsG [Bacillus paramycoides]MED1464783.1 exosporium protein ExsG [Bacillus paramycoides]MED1493310.1 exosporium protein ExsG [Bacillus paramycoides]
MEFQLLVNCVLQEGNAYFLVTKVDDVITLKVPITEGVSGLFLALGVPKYS